MKLTGIMSIVATFLAIFVYGRVISVRVATLIFLLFASFTVCLVFIWPNLRRTK
jgi:hypothetical protein